MPGNWVPSNMKKNVFESVSDWVGATFSQEWRRSREAWKWDGKWQRRQRNKGLVLLLHFLCLGLNASDDCRVQQYNKMAVRKTLPKYIVLFGRIKKELSKKCYLRSDSGHASKILRISMHDFHHKLCLLMYYEGLQMTRCDGRVVCTLIQLSSLSSFIFTNKSTQIQCITSSKDCRTTL